MVLPSRTVRISRSFIPLAVSIFHSISHPLSAHRVSGGLHVVPLEYCSSILSHFILQVFCLSLSVFRQRKVASSEVSPVVYPHSGSTRVKSWEDDGAVENCA